MKKEVKRILLSHGSGGKLTQILIETVFKKAFSNPILNKFDDSAMLNLKQNNKVLAFTTDSFVVNPIFFPGGDIGVLAVNGTVNDLSMKGAKPLWMSVSFILEEGLEISLLEKIVRSMKKEAHKAGVVIVTGDTKVVEKGSCDKIFINTSGIGIIKKGVNISSSNAKLGDDILINGNIADHGIAVLTARNNFKLNANIKTDSAPLNHLVDVMLKASKNIHVLRDPTRGGLATTINEISKASNIGIILDESKIPISGAVRSACMILGFDPLYIANEGKLVSFVPKKDSGKVLNLMKSNKYAKDSSIIGCTTKSVKGVWIKTLSGGLRPLIVLEGEQLPRIC